MAFSDMQLSESGGAPVELYRFNIAGVNYLYTNSAEDFTNAEGAVYKHKAIKRGELKSDKADQPLKIEIPFNDPLVVILNNYSADGTITVDVSSVHTTDPDKEVQILWSGRLITRTRSNYKHVMTCEPLASYMQGSGLRGRYQRTCRYTLYKTGCRASAGAVQVEGAITAKDGVTLQIAELATKPNGYFSGGIVRVKGSQTARMILNHTSDAIVITDPLSGADAGVTMQVLPGCDHSLETCRSKFNNGDNFGGFAWIPRKNPFKFTSIV